MLGLDEHLRAPYEKSPNKHPQPKYDKADKGKDTCFQAVSPVRPAPLTPAGRKRPPSPTEILSRDSGANGSRELSLTRNSVETGAFAVSGLPLVQPNGRFVHMST